MRIFDLLVCNDTAAAVLDVDGAQMDLYLKAGPDGKSVGDCPFAHYVRMVLHVKDLKCNLRPCPAGDDAAKPKWLVDEFEGKMPCLDDAGTRKVESSVIAEYLEEKYPEPAMSRGFDEAAVVDAQNAAKDIFPAMAKLVKSADSDTHAEEKALLKAAADFQDFWEKKESGCAKGAYLTGERLSLLDCSLAPKLYHLSVAVKKFSPDTHKKVLGGDDYPALKKYSSTMFAHPAFAATKYPENVVVWGWEEARKKAAEGSGEGCAV